MPLVFNREFAPAIGEAVTVAPHVRRITAPNPGPFTFRGTNSYLVGDDPVAVIDPGPAIDAHIEALFAAIGTARVAHIIVTHTHRDHSPGARLLRQRFDAPVLGAGRHRPARPPRTPEEVQLDAGGDLDFVPDRMLADGSIVEGDGYRLQAIATPGHTANHLAYAWPDRGLIFSGDHVMGWSTTVVSPPDGSMADYMASLDRLEARPEGLYLPGHGPAIEDGPAYVRELRGHRLAREAAILDGLRQGDRRIPEIVTRVYAGLDPLLARGAALSVLAHLENLVAHGLAAADEPPTLNARYWAAEATPPGPGSG